MGIASGFLAGQQAKNQAEAQQLGLLSALINRPTKSGGAIRYAGGGGGGGRAVGRKEEEALEAAEEREAQRHDMAEEAHDRDMERKDLETEILRQAKGEKEDETFNKKQDRARALRKEKTASQIQQGSMQDTLDYQEQQRHFKAYSDAVYRGDATAADRHFRGMYPGMDGDTRPATVKRQLKDEQGNFVYNKETGEPEMMETPDRYVSGEKVSEEDYQKSQMSWPKHRSDGGVVYMQFGDETPVPVGPGRLRQIHTSIHPSMMQQSGGGGAGAGGTGTAGAKTAKEASVIALNNVKKGKAIVSGAVTYAKEKPYLKEGEEYDPLTGPPEKPAEVWMKDFVEGSKFISGMSTKQQEEAGMGKAIRPLGPKASKQFARKSREWFDRTIESGSPPPDIRQMIQRAKAEHGLGVAHEMNKMFAPELTPSNLTFKAESPKETPDFGHGKDNVLHVYDKDLGPDGLGIAIDKKTKQPKRWDKNAGGWIPVEPSVLRAYANLLNEKANQGDKDAEKMLSLLDAPRARPFSYEDLLSPVLTAGSKAGSALADTLKEEGRRMGQWVEGGRPQELGPKADISQPGM